MPIGNGGIIGVANNPTSTTATGIWSLQEQLKAKAAGNWPVTVNQKGLTAGDPAVSATEVWTSGGGTASDGAYYIQNIYTGNSVKQCYCRLNVDGLHYQRWSLMDLAGYNDNGNYGQTGTASEADNATIASDSSATSTGWYKETGTNTGQGGSTTYDTGLQLSTVAGHYWALYAYQQSPGGGGWAQNGGLDWGASASGGDWGSTYIPDIYMVGRGSAPTGNGRHMLTRAVWGATSCATTFVGSITSYADMWSQAGNWSVNSSSVTSGTNPVTGITTTDYIGMRVLAFSDDSTNGRYYYAFWVYIP
jgi:hypothetical protein